MEIPTLPRCKADDEDMEKLHAAARKGNAELVNRLINGGIYHSIQNKFGCTAMHLACKNGHVGVVRVLGERQVTLGPWHGRWAVHQAVLGRDTELLEELCYAVERHPNNDFNSFINQPSEEELEVDGEHTSTLTALHYTVLSNNSEMTKKLIQKGAATNLRDKLGRTPLMYALRLPDPALFQTLIGEHVSIHVQDKKGANVLHMALRSDRDDLASLLIQAVQHESPESTNSFLVAEDELKQSPFSLMIEMGKVTLLQSCIDKIDNFSFQQTRFHDSRTVHPERIPWCIPHASPQRPVSDSQAEFSDNQFSAEERKDAIVRMLQAKLDSINNEGGDRKMKKKQDISLAPSSPGRTKLPTPESSRK
eukprot:TRINITY_DN10196_c0_g1_i1.p1 TRINITY_DN10196_c0_g1~~TRINITY_DN10196_c0_g1_i1.p1  ORF type:complete len:364 (+),score=80.46 TRINITY_DN10196_c0_g1_i1:1164-2255(+)